MNFGDNLKKLRNDANMSQEQLAEKLNISRQSVSKWESNISYPEMDKVLQLCKLFNVNIDELLNQDITEVTDRHETKKNVNNFIDSTLSYITKTIDVFSSMTLKCKFKCIFEQVIIVFILSIIFVLLGIILSSISQNILSFLHIYNSVNDILFSLYLLAALIIGIVIILHVFKIRYLDYYEIVSNVDTKRYDVINDEKGEDKKQVIVRKEEKIIIRDKIDTKYKFINTLLKIILFLFKISITFIMLILILLLVSEIILLVVSFLFVKTGLLFIGSIISIVSIIVINIMLIIMCYNLIISHKNKLRRLFIIILVSIITFGIGIGLFAISIKDFEVINDIEPKYYLTKDIEIEMSDNLVIKPYSDNVSYEEVDSDSVNISITYPKNGSFDVEEENGVYYIFYYENEFKSYNNDIIDMINSKKIYNLYRHNIVIKSNKENISKIKKNIELFNIEVYENINEEEKSNLMNRINELENENYALKEEISNLKNMIQTYKDNRKDIMDE